MKKKIFLMVSMITILVCVLALSINAATYDTARSVVLDDDTSLALYDEEGNALSYYMSNGTLTAVKTSEILSTGTANISGVTYTTFAFNGVNALDMVVVNFQDEKLGDLQVFNTKFQGSTVLEYCYMPKTLERLSVNYDSANVFRETTKCKIVDFPVDCELTFIGKYSFSKATALQEIYIPVGVEVFPEGSGWDWGCFWQCTSLTKVTFAENSRLKNVPNGTFRDCTALTEILLPDSVETLGIYVFRDSGIVNSPFSPSSNCTYIAKWAFAYATNLQNINIPRNATFDTTSNPEGTGLFHNCSSLETVNFHPDTIDTLYPAFMFSNCTSLKSIKLPNCLTQLSVRMFNGCTSLETIVFGANVQGINSLRNLSDHNSFTFGCNNLKYVYLPKTLNISAETHSTACYMFNAGGNVTFYFNGTYDEAVKLQNDFKTNVTTCGGQNGKITGAEIISLENYNALTEIKKSYIVYDCNTCDMFYGSEHEEDNNPCVINCGRCNANGVAEENPIHNIGTTITYVSFDTAGIKKIGCTNAGCAYGTTEEASALFVCQGYSAPENGKGGIAIGFTVNSTAIAEYKEVTGKTVSYGVFAVLKDKLNGNDIFVDGEANPCAIVGDVTAYATAAFEVKIVGFETDTQKTAKIAMGAYVKVDNDYSYMQSSAPDENEKYCFDSFNDVLAQLSSKA
ncbi:MAG: leucine-rich repeat domain-containing protein [Clostridia bacterium]|nr:leucine-rich repeat domain-containing protein [Clostridia bacterium]